MNVKDPVLLDISSSWPPQYVQVGETGGERKGNDFFFFLDVKN